MTIPETVDRERTAYVALGGNLGDPGAAFDAALDLLREIPGVRVARVSTRRRTSPVGGPPQPDYLNAVAEVITQLAPEDLLRALTGIENRLGRERTVRWGPSTLDLDLLLMEDLRRSGPGLLLPHPRMAERRFVLEPMCELAPEAVHPVLDRTMSELVRMCRAT